MWKRSLLFGLLLSLPALSEGWSPELVGRIRAVGGVRTSADGRWTVYTVNQPRQLGKPNFEDGPAYTEVYRLDGRPLLTARSGASALKFTSDGRALTFLSKRAGDEFTSLYRLPLDGGEAERIQTFPNDIRDYALEPGGRRVAVLAAAPADKDRSRRRKLGFTAQVFEEDWENTQVYWGPLGGELKSLNLAGSAGEIHWAGGTIAVTQAPNPGVDADLMYRRVHLLDAGSGAARAVVQNPGKLGQISLSPDGKQLALLCGEDQHDPDNGRLWLADTATGKTRDLWPGLDARVSKVQWIGNGKLRGLIWKGLGSEIWDIDIQGSKSRRQEAGEEVITDLAASGDGRETYYVSESWRHPGELFVQDGSSAPRRLTDLNPELKTVSWAKQEAVEYTARDGQKIQGVLIHPLNEQPGQRYPLIMWVHGGPESLIFNSWLNAYSHPGQVAAARGIASFYPNYRGSIGRSVEFSKLGQKDPAGREFEDLVDGVDALVARGLVDKDRVGVTGGSYGGYATAWCSTYYSERFKAGVMAVGISDKVSKSGTTDIPDEEFLVHARQHPWDNWEFFAQRSPIRHVQKHHTPLLIMHGKDDPRVHPSQSLELFRYLKVLGQAPVRLVLYPGEGHGNRKAAARYDFQLRMLEWMEHYLKGPGGAPPAWDIKADAPK